MFCSVASKVKFEEALRVSETIDQIRMGLPHCALIRRGQRRGRRRQILAAAVRWIHRQDWMNVRDANSFLKIGTPLARIPFHTWRPFPPTPSADLRYFGLRLRQVGAMCFRSYPRNYTSVWLSASTPGPQDVGTRYQTLIACRVLPFPIRYPPPPPLPVWPAFMSSLSFRFLSRGITDDQGTFVSHEWERTVEGQPPRNRVFSRLKSRASRYFYKAINRHIAINYNWNFEFLKFCSSVFE